MVTMEEKRRAMFEAVVSPAAGVEFFPHCEIPGADAKVITSDGRSIPVHSSILASASPVLENKFTRERPRKRGSSEKVIPILGVPCNAVIAFLKYIYTSRCTGEDMEGYGMHLLVLSHVFRIPGLKRACEAALGERLTVDDVVDVLKLARLCDASRLSVRCMKLLAADFCAVEQTEGWRFLQAHDPCLELELLQSLEETEKGEKKRARNRRAQSVYVQLSEAMECLRHICTEGCTEVGALHLHRDPPDTKGAPPPCDRFCTCQGLQRLIRHFATCEKKKKKKCGGCVHCKRMWQLLRLHASICDQPEHCKVPLCKQFKMRKQVEAKGEEDERWRLLVRKVVSAKVMSTLSKRKREEDHHLHKTWTR